MSINVDSIGSFTSTGANVLIPLRQGVDWFRVLNYTQGVATQSGPVGVTYAWQNGFPSGAAWVTYKGASAAVTANLITSAGFSLYDSSLQAPGQLNATITAISAASIPVVTNTGTNGLLPGSIVRLINVTSAQQLGGMDFTVGYNTLSSTTFSLDYMAQIVAGTAGSWRQINYDPIYYPRRRTITKVATGTTTVVTLSVTHGYQVGQQVRFAVPSSSGMTQLNGRTGNIIAINTTTTSGNTITVDIDSSAFTAFSFPLSAAVPFTPAEVIPVGEDTPTALAFGVDILTDATINTATMGIILTGGAGSPAGASGDKIYWESGTADIVMNV